MLSSPCHHSSSPSPLGGTEAAVGGSSGCFSASIYCPQQPLQFFTPFVCSLLLNFKHIPTRTLHALHRGSHPILLLSQSLEPRRYWAPADGQRSRVIAPWAHCHTPHLPGSSQGCSTLMLHCLLHRNSGICPQLQLGMIPPTICFLAQELKRVFRGSKSVRLLF